jgi:hypothetical protein
LTRSDGYIISISPSLKQVKKGIVRTSRNGIVTEIVLAINKQVFWVTDSFAAFEEEPNGYKGR